MHDRGRLGAHRADHLGRSRHRGHPPAVAADDREQAEGPVLDGEEVLAGAAPRDRAEHPGRRELGGRQAGPAPGARTGPRRRGRSRTRPAPRRRRRDRAPRAGPTPKSPTPAGIGRLHTCTTGRVRSVEPVGGRGAIPVPRGDLASGPACPRGRPADDDRRVQPEGTSTEMPRSRLFSHVTPLTAAQTRSSEPVTGQP